MTHTHYLEFMQFVTNISISFSVITSNLLAMMEHASSYPDVVMDCLIVMTKAMKTIARRYT